MGQSAEQKKAAAMQTQSAAAAEERQKQEDARIRAQEANAQDRLTRQRMGREAILATAGKGEAVAHRTTAEDILAADAQKATATSADTNPRKRIMGNKTQSNPRLTAGYAGSKAGQNARFPTNTGIMKPSASLLG